MMTLEAGQEAGDLLRAEDIDGTDQRDVGVWANEHRTALRRYIIQAVNARSCQLHVGNVGHHRIVDVDTGANID